MEGIVDHGRRFGGFGGSGVRGSIGIQWPRTGEWRKGSVDRHDRSASPDPSPRTAEPRTAVSV